METPIETAQRVWPGEWTSPYTGFLRLTLSDHLFTSSIAAWHTDGRWVIELNRPGVGRDIASSADLAEALIDARTKAIEAVKELVRNVGGIDG